MNGPANIAPSPDIATGHRTSGRSAMVRLAAALTALLLISAMVIGTSRSAFSDTTTNPGNAWAAGTVVISDDDGGSSAMFNATNMKPGSSNTNCIVTTYSGSLVPATVTLYGVSGGTGLDAFLDVTITMGTGGAFGSCIGFVADAGPAAFTGTLAAFAAAHTNFANGIAGWSPAANPESKTYQIAVSLQDNNAAQGLNGTATFTWEAQNQ